MQFLNSALLVLVMALSSAVLAACGPDDDQDDGLGDVQPTPTREAFGGQYTPSGQASGGPFGGQYGGPASDADRETASLLVLRPWWQQQPFQALYVFYRDGRGSRQVFPSSAFHVAPPASSFIWRLNGRDLDIQFLSYYQGVRLQGYDTQRDILSVETSDAGPAFWFGCRSGALPPIVAENVCLQR